MDDARRFGRPPEHKLSKIAVFCEQEAIFDTCTADNFQVSGAGKVIPNVSYIVSGFVKPFY